MIGAPGPSDAGEDAGDSRPDDRLRRRDAGTGSTDPIQACQRFDPLGCPAGQVCKVLVRRAPNETEYTIDEGCVDPGVERGEGDPCDAFGGFSDPYRTDGLVDEVHVDPCGEGLFCALSNEVRGVGTCHRACATTFVSGYARACTGAGAFCAGGQPLQQVCRGSDGCDPTDPLACGEGSGCYLRLGDDGESVLTVCLPVRENPIDDGDSCIDATTGTYFLNACNPGSQCWGPVRLAPSNWIETDYVCRKSCVPGATGSDAGADDDAGVASAPGTCPANDSCIDFSESALDISTIDAAFGSCE